MTTDREALEFMTADFIAFIRTRLEQHLADEKSATRTLKHVADSERVLRDAYLTFIENVEMNSNRWLELAEEWRKFRAEERLLFRGYRHFNALLTVLISAVSSLLVLVLYLELLR